jgi:hypothetical protein
MPSDVLRCSLGYRIAPAENLCLRRWFLWAGAWIDTFSITCTGDSYRFRFLGFSPDFWNRLSGEALKQQSP